MPGNNGASMLLHCLLKAVQPPQSGGNGRAFDMSNSLVSLLDQVRGREESDLLITRSNETAVDPFHRAINQYERNSAICERAEQRPRRSAVLGGSDDQTIYFARQQHLDMT